MNRSAQPHWRRSRLRRAAGRFAVACLTAGLSAATACSSSNGPGASTAASSERKDALERLDAATRVVAEFRAEIADAVAAEARCVVAVPVLVQGGLVVGGRGGRGFAGCLKKGAEWGEPAPVVISGASFGAQIGVEKTDVLMLVMNDEAKSALLEGHFELGVDASAAAGPVGTEASKDFKAESGLLSYERSKGLFAGATLSGATISRDDEATQALYGGLPELRSLLQGPMPSPGAPADRFVAAVRDAFGASARPAAAFEPGMGGPLGRR
jgi:lipid-binding SYLF domain-containing protein